jgi:hypothetical protein
VVTLHKGYVRWAKEQADASPQLQAFQYFLVLRDAATAQEKAQAATHRPIMHSAPVTRKLHCTTAAAITLHVWRSALQRCTHGTLGGSDPLPSVGLPCLHVPTWTLMLSANHAVLSLHNHTHCSRPGMRLFREHAVTRHHRARTRLPVRRPGGWGAGGGGVGVWVGGLGGHCINVPRAGDTSVPECSRTSRCQL